MNRKYILTIVFSILMVTAILAVQTFSAYSVSEAQAMSNAVAAEATETPSASGGCSLDDAYCLEQLYPALVSLVDKQNKKVDAAHKTFEETERLINELNDQGVDTWELRYALEAYGWTISEAEESHNYATELLQIHDGFDENGDITVLAFAKATIVNCKEAWITALQKYNSANLSLSAVIWKYKKYEE